MIIDLSRFIREEQPYWDELDAMLTRLERDLACRLTLGEVKRLHYLYRRTSSDLAKVATFSAEPHMRRYLETLVGRAYGHVHAGSERPSEFRLKRWLGVTFPRTFRRRIRAFQLALAVTLVGVLFGGAVAALDPSAKAVIMPFQHLRGDPSERVAQEESVDHDRLTGRRASFAASLMTHNTRVSILAMALGMTWGIGTIAVLFSNGIMLGAVCLDYVLAGESLFLAGWLLPHGIVEIPAILLAGQAGLVLAGALIGRGTPRTLRQRLRHVGPDVVTLIFGVALMLVWAGCVEAFLSQYHEPLVPYWSKVLFGLIEGSGLALFLWRAGRSGEESGQDAAFIDLSAAEEA